MLVLNRREQEKIMIPQLGITIQVVRVQGRTVKIGIECPKEYLVLREENLSKRDLEKELPTENPREDKR